MCVRSCWTGDNKSVGTCGPPSAGVEVKLVDAPEVHLVSHGIACSC